MKGETRSSSFHCFLRTPFWKDVLKNQQNDEFIKKWREILIGSLVSDDVMAIWQDFFKVQFVSNILS